MPVAMTKHEREVFLADVHIGVIRHSRAGAGAAHGARLVLVRARRGAVGGDGPDLAQGTAADTCR